MSSHTRIGGVMGLVAAVVGAVPAFGSFHSMQIEQVIGGVNGDVTAQAIQLRMRGGEQNFVSAARVVVRDAAGLNPITVIDMTTDVPNDEGGRRVLIASSSFITQAFPNITPDFIITNHIPPSYLAAGTLTFEDDFGTVYWRLSWGGAGYTGTGSVDTTNDEDGNANPPFGGALPSNSTNALRFPGLNIDPSTNNLAQYAITGPNATFINNANQPTTVFTAGACCDDSTGVCMAGVTQATCQGGGDRYGGDDSTCATIDPPCLATCGNGVIEPTHEECDPTAVPNGCVSPSVCCAIGDVRPECVGVQSCACAPFCGNDNIETGEDCDPPGALVCPGGSACPSDCTCPLNDILWDPATNPTPWPNVNPLATTRSLRFTVTGPAGPSKLEAIKVTMVDLQHPRPANLPANPPTNFTAFDTRVNGTCVGGTIPGHHCDTNADCTGGGTCSSLAACTADPTCTNAAACTLPSNGCARWVGKPGTFYEAQGPPVSGPYKAARLQCTPYYWDWKPEGMIAVVGAEIAPSSEYSVQVYPASCMGAESGCTNVSAPVTMYTRRAGDVEQPFNPPSTSGQPDVTDVAQLVNKFKNLPGAPVKAIAQLQPNLPELNADINAIDIVEVVVSVKGSRYAYSGPCVCPSPVTCGFTPCPSGPGVCVANYGSGSTCVKTCNGGANAGDPCINRTHCPGGNCGRVCVGGTNDGLGCDLAGHCPKSCVGGSNPGVPCPTGTECLDGGTCPSTTCVASTPNQFCRDRCGRCTP